MSVTKRPYSDLEQAAKTAWDESSCFGHAISGITANRHSILTGKRACSPLPNVQAIGSGVGGVFVVGAHCRVEEDFDLKSFVGGKP